MSHTVHSRRLQITATQEVTLYKLMYLLSDGRIQKLVKELKTYNRKFKHIQVYSRPI